MKRGGRLARRTPLRQVSTKVRDERSQREQVRAEVIARDRVCTAALLVPDVTCWGPLDVHEMIQRSLWRKGYLDQDNCRAVCRAHHDWIDDNSAVAHELGLLRHSWDR